MRKGMTLTRKLGTVLAGAALATTGAVAVAAPAQAAGCSVDFLYPNGGTAWCSYESGTAYQVMIRCVAGNYYSYYRTGPWLYPGTSATSRVYCDSSYDSRTNVWVNTPD
jgi:hypothetical protein